MEESFQPFNYKKLPQTNGYWYTNISDINCKPHFDNVSSHKRKMENNDANSYEFSTQYEPSKFPNKKNKDLKHYFNILKNRKILNASSSSVHSCKKPHLSSQLTVSLNKLHARLFDRENIIKLLENDKNEEVKQTDLHLSSNQKSDDACTEAVDDDCADSSQKFDFSDKHKHAIHNKDLRGKIAHICDFILDRKKTNHDAYTDDPTAGWSTNNSMNGIRISIAGASDVDIDTHIGHMRRLFSRRNETDNVNEAKEFIVLQDAILKLRENEYSTKEELQATVRELVDAQDKIIQLEAEKQTLVEERNMLAKLLSGNSYYGTSSQSVVDDDTEKLIDSLTNLEKSQIACLKENMIKKIKVMEEKLNRANEAANCFKDRAICSEIQLKTQISLSEKVESELRFCRQSLEHQHMELQKLQASLENERKLAEGIRKERNFSESELQSMVETLKAKNYDLESKNVVLEESIKTAQRNVNNLKLQIKTNEEKWNSQREDYRSALTVLEKELEDVIQEKAHAQVMWAEICEEKKKLEMLLNQKNKEFGAELLELKNKCQNLENECSDLRRKLDDEHSKRLNDLMEWKEFQRDLQTAVRVANDLKTEAEEKVKTLEDEIARLKKMEVVLNEELTNAKKDNTSVVSRQNEFSPAVKDLGLVYRTPIKDIIRRLEKSMTLPKNGISKQPHESITDLHKDKNKSKRVDSSHGTTTDDVKAIAKSHRTIHRTSAPEIESFQSAKRSDDRYSILSVLAKRYPHNGCKRNALLKWCRDRVYSYKGVEITNFSSSWSDGKALLSLLHSFLPDKIPLEKLLANNNRQELFEFAFSVAEAEGISTTLNLQDILNSERPQWEPIMDYITEIYRHFEYDVSENRNSAFPNDSRDAEINL